MSPGQQIRPFLLIALFFTWQRPAAAIIIDDFTQGGVTLVDSPALGSVSDQKTGLDPAHVVGGARDIRFNAIDGDLFNDLGVVEIEIDTTGEGALRQKPDPGVDAANLYLSYGKTSLGLPPLAVDLLADGASRLVFEFGYTVPVPYLNRPQLFGLDVWMRSGSGSVQYYGGFALPISSDPFRLEIPFHEITTTRPNFDLSNVTEIQFGTSNGNLHGNFELRRVFTEAPELPGSCLACAGTLLLLVSAWRRRTRRPAS